MVSRKICIFGASADKLDETLIRQVTDFSEKLGKAGFSLVFGGFSNGLMKASADGFAKAGTAITGVVPESLTRNRTIYPGCTEIIRTIDLDERKKKMTDLADAFIAVPGGIGTIDELFGVLTRRFIGETAKPLALYNPDGFFDSFIMWMKELENKGFIYDGLDKLLLVSDDPDTIIQYLSDLTN